MSVQFFRICLLDGSGSDDDPLVEACKCKGSIQYVHLGCLRYWITGRLNLSDAGEKNVYQFKQLSCELCKELYPIQVCHVKGGRDWREELCNGGEALRGTLIDVPIGLP